MKTVDFLDAVKRKHNLQHDSDAAFLLGIKRAAVSNYRRGLGFFDDDVAVRAADLLALEPAYVLACIHAERAGRAKQLDVKAAWERAADFFKSAAASLCAVFVASALLFPSPNADASAFNISKITQHSRGGFSAQSEVGTYIIRFRRGRFWRRLLASFGLFFCLASPSFADGVWALQLNGTSVHPNANVQYNERNDGLGVQYTERDGNSVTRYVAGTLINSMSDRTWYAGAVYGRRLAPRVDVGAFVGAITYPTSGYAVLPALLPVLTIGTDAAHLHATYIPAVSGKGTDAILFQLAVAF